MKVLLCGEGAHEVGRLTWSNKKREWEVQPGWMQPLVQKLAPEPLEYETRLRNELTLLPRVAANFRPLPAGHGKKALAAALIAKSLGADVVVFMADADSNDPADWAVVHGQIAEGFQAATGAGLEANGVACVPMATSECWLLSDGAAWQTVSGSTPELPKHPEKLWGGRGDPQGNHPKHAFRRISDQVGISDSPESRASLASESGVAAIEQCCPHSFGKFVAEMAAAFEPKAA